MLPPSGASTLPRGFRIDLPATPEPPTREMSSVELDVDGDVDPTQPPRPRLRVRRRVASATLAAPTQHFLASVAAADVPIPSIEEPDQFSYCCDDADNSDDEMADTTYPVFHQLADIGNRSFQLEQEQARRGRRFSPPKTPAPGALPSLSPRRYPDWTMESFSSSESSPECESSRPSTARSTQTSASVFSRYSITTEDLAGGGANGKNDVAEPFPSLSAEAPIEFAPQLKAGGGKEKQQLRRLPWTHAMTQHLWATYSMYLQDPNVTPFRASKTGIPPQGVCIRVAREAKRSWKGSKHHQGQSSGRVGNHLRPAAATDNASIGTFIQWPHTLGATRSHLRDLCRARGSQHHRLSPAAAPSGRAHGRRYGGRRTPARSPSVFGSDLAISLAMSTSETMQPHGPLAQLTSSSPMPEDSPLESIEHQLLLRMPGSGESGGGQAADGRHYGLLSAATPPAPRLGSPFVVKRYGPSPAESHDTAMLSPDQAEATVDTGADPSRPRRGLQSPVKMAHGRSRSTQQRASIQKLRGRAATNEPRRCRRPSVSEISFDAAAGPPLSPPGLEDERSEAAATSGMVHFDDVAVPPRTPHKRMEELFRPRALTTIMMQSPPIMAALGPPLVAAQSQPEPPRLGSPFPIGGMNMNSSFSFPSRLGNPVEADGGRPFATLQVQPSSGDVFPPRDLANRLAYVDLRLRELRQGHRRRRSDSPY